ncbi:MAG: PoNi-like cognate immunity protein [Ruminococcus flavefaciens]|nr:PoNi-like cognate immunity protein [Ruminococcus flavefaciens]
MRDFIKSREYFDIFILEDSDRVEKFENKIKSGSVKDDRILPVKDKLIQIKIGIIIAKYSRGDSIELLKNEFEALIDLFVEAWNLESYEDNLRFASLAYLLNVDTNLKERIREKLKNAKHYDYLIDFVLIDQNSSLDKEDLSYSESYRKLVDFIGDRNIDVLLEYLHGWYNDHDHSAWFDSHKSTKVNVYYGYWCFEAAAIIKRLGLGDEMLKNEMYYPYDMAHFTE